jgi:TolA-binding protein
VPLVVILLGGALGCAASGWRRAQAADSAEAYRAFLRDHPNAPAAEAALLALGDQEFEVASEQHTVLAFKRFLEEFPDHPRSSDARALLEGLRFNAAKQKGTADGWRQFLADHPRGAHKAEAERALAEAEFSQLDPGTASGELQRLVREHPDDPRRSELQTRLDDDAFAAAQKDGAFGLFSYLREFPGGAHRERAHAALLGLKLEGLVHSGQTALARAELGRSPLAPALAHVADALEAAEEEERLLRGAELRLRLALVGHYLRSVDDLVRALSAPDPLDRWQAAEELGQHVNIAVIDPLLSAFRSARNPLIRQRALDSLAHVLGALPKGVADYEVASRLELLRPTASSPEVWVVVAALLDMAGRLEEAASEYQRAYSSHNPDPVILRRWIDIRAQRGQSFSAAVAARQLALWAKEVASEFDATGTGRVSVIDARQLCAAALNARHALGAIRAAREVPTDFAEDLVQFELTATDAVRLADARLGDAELLLRTGAPHQRTCDDDRVAERVAASLEERARALQALGGQAGSQAARAVLRKVSSQDPSPRLRAAAATLR